MRRPPRDTAAGAPSSTRLPLRLALLAERGDALLRVLALQHAVGDVPRQPHARLQREFLAAPPGFLDGLHREWRVLQDLGGPAIGAGQQVLARRDLVADAEAMRIVRRDELPAQEEPHARLPGQRVQALA